jgi:hypothetical protein
MPRSPNFSPSFKFLKVRMCLLCPLRSAYPGYLFFNKNNNSNYYYYYYYYYYYVFVYVYVFVLYVHFLVSALTLG